ncbi:hypothetical protein DICVIV_05928 [Dictyocaulus viviparus]|uniref:Uncharacterized protein n=1 Tax=Dictyocaulus viviparus TaxID=29172 RepID=A0A0D8XTP0_DICVI|nr:hypothetical protein DICVIV_05928 [Dictyocaulus viviparus]
MVVVSAFTHLLPYIACTAYPIILTAMNKEIHNTHSLIIDNKRRQLSTMRHGALQTMMTQTSLFQPWTRLVIIQKKHSVT